MQVCFRNGVGRDECKALKIYQQWLFNYLNQRPHLEVVLDARCPMVSRKKTTLKIEVYIFMQHPHPREPLHY